MPASRSPLVVITAMAMSDLGDAMRLGQQAAHQPRLRQRQRRAAGADAQEGAQIAMRVRVLL